MFRKFESQPQHESFADLVKHLKWRYRRAHPGETEGLHFQFNEGCLPGGRSGFLKAERLESTANGPAPRTESVLIDDSRVVGYQIDEQLPEGVDAWRWLE
jgi:hypothetical protein